MTRAALVLALAVVATGCRRASRERPDAGPNAAGLHEKDEYRLFCCRATSRRLPPPDPDDQYPAREYNLVDAPKPQPVEGLDGVRRIDVVLPRWATYHRTIYQLSLLVSPDFDDLRAEIPTLNDDTLYLYVTLHGERFYTLFDHGPGVLAAIVDFLNDVLRSADLPGRLLVLSDGRTVVGGRGDVLARAVDAGTLVPMPRD